MTLFFAHAHTFTILSINIKMHLKSLQMYVCIRNTKKLKTLQLYRYIASLSAFHQNYHGECSEKIRPFVDSAHGMCQLPSCKRWSHVVIFFSRILYSLTSFALVYYYKMPLTSGKLFKPLSAFKV